MPRAVFHKDWAAGARGFLNIPTREAKTAGTAALTGRQDFLYNKTTIPFMDKWMLRREGVALLKLREYKNLHLLILFAVFGSTYIINNVLEIQCFAVSLIYNLLMLALSALFLKADFQLNPFRPTAPLPRTLGWGALLALAMAAVIFLLGFLFRVVNLLPVLAGGYDVPRLLRFFAIQIVVACSEEALFRFYLFRCLLDAFRSRFWAALLVSLLFAGVHIAFNGIWIQFFIALGISLVFFAVLQKQPKNAYYLLVSAHFFYNLLVQLVFCM